MTSYKRLTLGSKTERLKAKGRKKKKKKVQANSNQRTAEVMILLSEIQSLN